MVTLDNAFRKLYRRFETAGISSPALEARVLLCFVCGINTDEYYKNSEKPLPRIAEERLFKLADEREKGRPLAYIVGEWEFYSLLFKVSEAVLIPRQDTETLTEAAIDAAKSETCPPRLLDLCCGSGCAGIATATHLLKSALVLADISEDAIEIAKSNAARYLPNGSYQVEKADALSKYDGLYGRFDILLCNPPYVTDDEMKTIDVSVRDFEPSLALCGGPDGLQFYRAITVKWKDALNVGGHLLFECGVGQAAAVSTLMQAAGYSNINIKKDLAGVDRVVYGMKL